MKRQNRAQRRGLIFLKGPVPRIRAAHRAAALLWAVCSACSGARTSDDAIVRDQLLRSVRLQERQWQNTGDPIQYSEWHDGSFKMINEIAYQKCKVGKDEITARTVRCLFIPHAPAIFRDGNQDFVIRDDGTAERVGERKWTPVELPGEGKQTVMSWKSVDTGGKWIAMAGEKLYEIGEDGRAAQIATLAYRDIILENGVKAAKVLMTRSMEQTAEWQGEVEGTTYREKAGGRSEAIQKIEYRTVKLDDGRQVPVLMARAVKGDPTWIGVRDGEVYRLE